MKETQYTAHTHQIAQDGGTGDPHSDRHSEDHHKTPEQNKQPAEAPAFPNRPNSYGQGQEPVMNQGIPSWAIEQFYAMMGQQAGMNPKAPESCSHPEGPCEHHQRSMENQSYTGPMSMPSELQGHPMFSGPQAMPQQGPASPFNHATAPPYAPTTMPGTAFHAQPFMQYGPPQSPGQYGPQAQAYPSMPPADHSGCGHGAHEHHDRHDQNQYQYQYGQLMDIVGDMMAGEPDASKIMRFFQGCDMQFLKGALIGAIGMFLLTNDTVKTTIANMISGIWGTFQKASSGAAENRSTPDSTAGSDKAES
ncbi:hypothetical protein CSB45_07255 [candidate division KSB3 bacterium]|uniref:Uncharacterized protein n=1 Tax=candidate division KSB3 bacterium TaxID=2044937 RepID=A0A2G6E6E4_9BACT|nr:MAG: hypothetical protein CSB45_07255 [candidate division KSB3 bacterium]PIE29973.1 MAG: hypothetical protein CSA57_05340 [candidate division KSB3 bacterium]